VIVVDGNRVKPARLSDCRRFVVIDALHIDRHLVEGLVRWADCRGLRLQDAIQLAICAFNESNDDLNNLNDREAPVPKSSTGCDSV
jgi:hypothetical protein